MTDFEQVNAQAEPETVETPAVEETEILNLLRKSLHLNP